MGGLDARVPDARAAVVTPGVEPPESRAVDAAGGELEGGTTDADALSAKVAKGLKWSLISTILGRIFTPITSIVLAHILVPEDFGVFSVALVVQSALMSFNDLGVTNALVWYRGDVRRAARTATTVAVATSGSLYALCFAVAPFIAVGMGSSSATGVLRLLAITVVIDGISSVPIGMLNREFRQDRRAFADWLGFVVSTGLTIGLAVLGFGAWSLAWGRVAGNLVTTTTLFVMSRERPRPGWDREVARQLVGYGLPLAGSSILVFAFLNLDYIIVGPTLGVAALGLYTIAFNLASWPSNVLSTTMRRVTIPAFSHLQNDPEALRATYLAALRNLMLVTLALCAGLCSLALPLVGLLYPEEYVGAAAVLAWLAVLGVGRVYLDLAYDLFSGIGRTRVLFVLQALWIALLVPALLIGANRGGIAGVALGHVVVAGVVMVPVFTWSIVRSGASLRLIVAAVARPVLAALAGGAAAVLVVRQLSGSLPALIAGGLTLVAVYGLGAASFSELRSLPRRFLRFEAVAPRAPQPRPELQPEPEPEPEPVA
jgi:O-antigen/teichoic acid export membrane protein